MRGDVARLVELWTRLMNGHAEMDPRFALTPDAPQQMSRRFQSLLQDRDALILVSETAGDVVGFGVGHLDANLSFFRGPIIGFISDVYVLEEYRRQGRAARLVNTLRGWFIQNRASSIQLHAAACNPGAHAFWRSMGFTDFLIRMWLDLEPGGSG